MKPDNEKFNNSRDLLFLQTTKNEKTLPIPNFTSSGRNIWKLPTYSNEVSNE